MIRLLRLGICTARPISAGEIGVDVVRTTVLFLGGWFVTERTLARRPQAVDVFSCGWELYL